MIANHVPAVTANDFPPLNFNNGENPCPTREIITKSTIVKLDIEEWDNDMDGVRKVTQAILKAFKKYAQHEEDWGDMTDQEISEARGEDAGRRYAGAMRSLGYRDGY